jgi:hypothetical protein
MIQPELFTDIGPRAQAHEVQRREEPAMLAAEAAAGPEQRIG